jgi:DNA repair exonuclease SbcCD ATPase subunit
MDHQFTEEEIQNEIFKIKEEVQFKERVDKVVKSQLDEVKVSFKELKQETETLLKSKDEEIRFINEKFNSLKELSESQNELINQNNKDVQDLNLIVSNIRNELLELKGKKDETIKSLQKEISQVKSDNLNMARKLSAKESEDAILSEQIRDFLIKEKEKGIKERKLSICGKTTHQYGCCYVFGTNYQSDIGKIIIKNIEEIFTGIGPASEVVRINLSLLNQPFFKKWSILLGNASSVYNREHTASNNSSPYDPFQDFHRKMTAFP